MIPAKVALKNNATCSGPSAAAVPNSTIVSTSRTISTTTGASASRSVGSRGGRAARARLGGLDVGDEGVVGEPGGLLVRVTGGLGRGEQDPQRRAVVRGRRGVDADLQPGAVAGPGDLLGGVTGAGQQGHGQPRSDDEEPGPAAGGSRDVHLCHR